MSLANIEIKSKIIYITIIFFKNLYHLNLRIHFRTVISLKYQRIESDIAETTMLHFAKENAPILPIHDSFICRHRYQKELEIMMSDTFEH